MISILLSARYKSRVCGLGKEGTRGVSIVARGGRVRSSSVEFCELAQWVAVPEWEERGLVLVKQTFVGPLNVLDGLAHLRAVSDVSCVLRQARTLQCPQRGVV